jgi:hypothetical protein
MEEALLSLLVRVDASSSDEHLCSKPHSLKGQQQLRA